MIIQRNARDYTAEVIVLAWLDGVGASDAARMLNAFRLVAVRLWPVAPAMTLPLLKVSLAGGSSSEVAACVYMRLYESEHSAFEISARALSRPNR
jgi:hypothetical protein